MPSTVEPQHLDAAEVASPLILDALDELLFFRSAAHLQAYVEAIDVANGEYGSCWDAEGRLFGVSVEKRSASVFGIVPFDHEVVRVSLVDAAPTHLPELHLALVRHLELVGLAEEMPTTNDTSDLLAFALEHSGWS